MKKLFLSVFLIITFGAVLAAQTATHVMISEVSPMKGASTAFGTGEFVELYNPLPADVVFGANVQIVSGNTSGSNAAEWQLSLSGKTIQAYGFLLIGDAGVAGADVNFPGSKNLANSGVRSCVQLRDGATVIDAFAWDASTTLAAEGTRFTPSGTTSDGKSFERKSSLLATAPDALGNAWDTNNNVADFFQNASAAANPQNFSSPIEVHEFSTGGDGSGSAVIFPSSFLKHETKSITIAIVGADTTKLDSITVAIPEGWTWGETPGDLSFQGNGFANVSASIDGDTVFLGGSLVTNIDTGFVTIQNIQAPDSAGSYEFVVKTAVENGIPKKISSLLFVSVTTVTPIIELHINNSQGVPVAPFQEGAVVTISGVITADLNPTRTDIYVQDETGAANIFSFSRSFNYEVGDSVTVTGSIVQFRGLVEISPDTTKYILHKKGAFIPEPLILTASEVNATFNTDDFTEPNESRLVRINNVTYNATASTITDATGTTGTFIANTMTAPTGAFDLIGILKQFKPGTPVPGAPFTADYEVVPRTQSDILLYAGPIITVPPYETNIKSNEVTIQWKTSDAASSSVKYGATTSLTDSAGDVALVTDHAITLPGLQPSTIYFYQVSSTDGSGTTTSATYFFITGSTSAGIMNVYFNKSIDPTVAQSETAKVADLSSVLINRINAAQHSIDFCTYSLSGTVGANVAAALLNARNRGVKIRVIGEKDNQGTAPWSTLKNGGVTVIDDGYDLTNAGNGLMHNKFFVFDCRDKSSSEDDWVIMGSWNATDPGTNNDAQNVVEIQDQSLATAYTIEFEEMWGSNTDSPNQGNSRFGSRKRDNTPHRFVIGTVPLESYFSPSDKVTMHINDALTTATSSINVAMLSFTRDELAQALAAKKNAGKKVRVLVDNNSDSGNDFTYLQSNGVDIRLPGAALTGLLHHKYAIVDADLPSDENIVVTGSHNWSSAAENSNNENTLIIHSKRVANLYLQEFKARYIEAGGADTILVSVTREDNTTPNEFLLQQNFPNPFNPETAIRFQIAKSGSVRLSVYDVLGREVASLMNQHLVPGVYTVRWNALSFSSGVYYCRLQSGDHVEAKKMILMK